MNHVAASTALFAVVKDVPKEAWPKGVYCYKGLYFKHEPYDDGSRATRLGPSVAEAAFVGSMTAWLVDRGFTVRRGLDGASYGALNVSEMSAVFWSGSLVSALACMCKGAKQ